MKYIVHFKIKESVEQNENFFDSAGLYSTRSGLRGLIEEGHSAQRLKNAAKFFNEFDRLSRSPKALNKKLLKKKGK